MTASTQNMAQLSAADAQQLLSRLGGAARISQQQIGRSELAMRNTALHQAASKIRAATGEIIAANQRDVAHGRAAGLSDAFIDRLMLDEARIEAMAAGAEHIAGMADPLGVELARWERPNGLDITRLSTALGVIGIIYESRPNVTVDAASLCIKSGNACILRGGSDSQETSYLLAGLMREGVQAAGLASDAVQMIPTPDRQAVGAMLEASGLIDVIIPRGGKGLVKRVQEQARVPVFAHLEGICHLYVSNHANPEKAVQIAMNAKMRRVGICGAAEAVLIHREIIDTVGRDIVTALIEAGCEVRGCPEISALHPDIKTASEADWGCEFLAPIIAVKSVSGLDEATSHIQTFSSGHTESILSEETAEQEAFFAAIDSAIVMANASTQFADGGEFGMGAEIGIATGRLHARGPVGANQLTSFKYIVRGHGQTRP